MVLQTEKWPRFSDINHLGGEGIGGMPGSRVHRESSIDTGHNGLSPPLDTCVPAQDITTLMSNKDVNKPHKPRRLNDYITIPRRLHPHNRKDYVDTTISQRQVTRVNSTEEDSTDVQPSVCGSPEKRERTWSFKKLRQALGRSKSFGKKDGEQTESTHSDAPCAVPHLSASHSDTKLEQSTHSQNIEPRSNLTRSDSDVYSELDITRVRSPWNRSPELPGNRLCYGNSSTSVSDPVSMDRRVAPPGAMDRRVAPPGTMERQPTTASSTRNVVGKVLSSLSNITTRRNNPKKQKQLVENTEYFSRDAIDGQAHRGSFKHDTKENPMYANYGARRCKSFNSPPKHRDHLGDTGHVAMDTNDVHGQYEVAGDDGIYSLAKSDTPPPLPERTYLKLRQSNSSSAIIQPPHMAYDATGKCISFGAKERNNNKTLTGTLPGHDTSSLDRPHHASRALPFVCETGYPSAKPFMLHQHPVSSGYGSVNSDTLSRVSMDLNCASATTQRAPTSCKLPRRSKRVSTNAPALPERNPGQAAGYYCNQEPQVSKSPSSSDQCRTIPEHSRLNNNDTSMGTLSDSTLLRNKVHNLPLLPNQSQAQLVQTIHLDNVLKDKWISGIAVTRKNEYIVVDQREAYLLEEDGTLKKTIGSKGSTRLIEPLNVTVASSNGNFVFCDHAEQDVKIYNWKGQFVRRVREQGLTNIAGVAVMDNRSIVIAGTDKKRVSVLSEEGKLLYTVPEEVKGENISPKKSPFEHPYSIAVNPLTGDIIVGDDTKQVVTAVSPCKEGQPARILWRYSPGSGKRHFFPSSICADNNGYIFIADLYNEMVYMLDSGGKFVQTLLSRGNGLKGGPGAIATDNKGHLLVADEEKTLKVFRYDDDKGFAVNRRYSFCPHVS